MSKKEMRSLFIYLRKKSNSDRITSIFANKIFINFLKKKNWIIENLKKIKGKELMRKKEKDKS
jgi:hypothetical protein